MRNRPLVDPCYHLAWASRLENRQTTKFTSQKWLRSMEIRIRKICKRSRKKFAIGKQNSHFASVRTDNGIIEFVSLIQRVVFVKQDITFFFSEENVTFSCCTFVFVALFLECSIWLQEWCSWLYCPRSRLPVMCCTYYYTCSLYILRIS